MTTIIVTHENNELDEYDFDLEIKTISIGRRSTNDVCIPNLSVSGQHAKITISDSGSMVEDLNSTNGTYINGRLISRQLLNDGDDIVIGKTRVTFLQPARKSAADAARQLGAADDIVEEAELHDDEEPLSLAEKAALHRQQMASESKRNGSVADSEAGKGRAAVQPEENESEFAGDYDDDFDESFIDEVGPGFEGAEYPPAEVDADAGAAVARKAKSGSSARTRSEAKDAALQNGAAAPSTKSLKPVAATAAVASAGLGRKAQSEQLIEEAEELVHELEDDPVSRSGAVIEIKNGAKSGQVLPIDKPVTTLGRPGIQIAAIMKKPEGYFLMHIESENNVDRPRLNDDTIGDEPVMLSSGDSLNVAGIDVQFMLS